MRHQRFWFCFAIVLGLSVRGIPGIVRSGDLTADADGYLAHAQSVAVSGEYLGPYTQQPTAFRPPAFPIALGLLMRCGLHEAGAVAVLNGAASLAILILTWQLSLQTGLSSLASLAAVLLVAFDPLLIRYAVLPMTEVPAAAALLGAVVCYRSLRSGDGNSRSARMAVCAGVLFGVGMLIRPVILLTCLFLFGHSVGKCLLHRPLRSGSRVLHQTAVLALPAAVAALTIAPWLVRNALQFHRFIPATTHGGYTLALGNNPDFYRDVINGPDVFPWEGDALDAWQRRMIAESGRDGVPLGDESAVDAWYYQQALTAMRSDPVSFLKASLLRLRRFWAVQTALDDGSAAVRITVAGWYVMIWVGLFLVWVRRWRDRAQQDLPDTADLWLVVLSFMVLHSVYWADTRMRAPLMPILCVLSVSGWTMLFRRRSRETNSVRR